jgi:general secretion pathway protein F
LPTDSRATLAFASRRGGWKNWRFLDFLTPDFTFERGLSKTSIANFTRELSVMLHAGQDIDHALRFLVETTDRKRARDILSGMHHQVRGGKSLSAALAEHPRVFSRLYISLVRAGESGGKLAESLAHLADLLERELASLRIQSALAYPILLAPRVDR